MNYIGNMLLRSCCYGGTEGVCLDRLMLGWEGRGGVVSSVSYVRAVVCLSKYL